MVSTSAWRTLAMMVLVFMLPIAANAEFEDESRKHFDRGVELADEKQFAEAAIEFQRSYELRMHFGILYNLGLAYLRIKPAKIGEAISALQRYLDEGGVHVPANRREEVEQEIYRQKSRIATLDLRGVPDGALIQVGDIVATAPLRGPLQVLVGTHKILVKAPNQVPIDVRVTVASGDYRVIDFSHPMNTVPHEPIVLPVKKPTEVPPRETVASNSSEHASTASPTAPLSTAAAHATAAAASNPQEIQGSQRRHILRAAGIVSAGVGLASLGTGAVLGLIAHSRNRSALENCQNVPCSDSAIALESQARSYATGANVAFVIGGVLMLSGVVLYLSAPAGKPDVQTQARLLLSIEPTFLGLITRGTW